MTDPTLPARIDRAALERILQRAAELQASERDIGEGLTAEEVLALGKDVGIPAGYLRQAMLEDRTRVTAPETHGFVDETVGPAEVSAARVVRGEPGQLERALVDWVQKNELFVIQRQQPGRITWERMGGMQAAIRRGFGTFESRRAKFMLDRAELLRGTVVSLEQGYSHVSLDASLRSVRGSLIGGAAAASVSSVAGVAVLTALHALSFIAAAPLVIGGGAAYLVLRRFRRVVERTQLGLERALDDLEAAASRPAEPSSPRGPGLLDLVTGEVRRAITTAAQQSSRRSPPPAKP